MENIHYVEEEKNVEVHINMILKKMRLKKFQVAHCV